MIISIVSILCILSIVGIVCMFSIVSTMCGTLTITLTLTVSPLVPLAAARSGQPHPIRATSPQHPCP